MRDHPPGLAIGTVYLKNDPEETTNLADQYPEMVREFDAEMQRMHVPTPNWPLPGETF